VASVPVVVGLVAAVLRDGALGRLQAFRAQHLDLGPI
jgi:hypothetical protein